jgi:hypothetical protein
MRWQLLGMVGLLLAGTRVAEAQNFGGGPPFILPAQAPSALNPHASSPYANRAGARSAAPSSEAQLSSHVVRKLDPLLAAPMHAGGTSSSNFHTARRPSTTANATFIQTVPNRAFAAETQLANWSGANLTGTGSNEVTLEYPSSSNWGDCGVGPIPESTPSESASPEASPLQTSWSYPPSQPGSMVGNDAPSRYPPGPAPPPPGATFGKGLLGQPKVYMVNQPLRNFFRYLTP